MQVKNADMVMVVGGPARGVGRQTGAHLEKNELLIINYCER